MFQQITGKAVMLDEIINYVQSLQQQVEVNMLIVYNYSYWFLIPCLPCLSRLNLDLTIKTQF